MLVSFGTRNYRCIRQLRADLTFAEGKAPNGYKEFTFYRQFLISSAFMPRI